MGIDIEELFTEIMRAAKAAMVGVPSVNLREGFASMPDGMKIESLHIVVLIDRMDAPTIANLSAEIEHLAAEAAPMHTSRIHILKNP